MFGKLAFVLCSLVATVACAHPNYQDDVPAATNEKPAGSCALAYASGLCVDLVWEMQPTEEEPGTFLLRFYSQQNPAIAVDPAAQVSVVLWMPSMGHGSSPVKVAPVENGVYRAENVFFVMPGEWEIHIKLKNNQNEIAEVVQNIRI